MPRIDILYSLPTSAELTSVRGSLFLNNPAGFVDPVFGLLGAAAAAGGANGADPDCLQQLIAGEPPKQNHKQMNLV